MTAALTTWVWGLPGLPENLDTRMLEFLNSCVRTLTTKRTRMLYKLKGYSDDWIEKRMRGIAIRE